MYDTPTHVTAELRYARFSVRKHAPPPSMPARQTVRSAIRGAYRQITAAIGVVHGALAAKHVRCRETWPGRSHFAMAEAVSADVPAVVIPYRNRRSHLDCMLARVRHLPVIVVEQADAHLPFNRGALLNIGYNMARNRGARRILLHDVDLVPDDTLLSMYSEPWPLPVVHFGARFSRYSNSRRYFGGVHGFTAGAFPGYPNHFWGWGGEDDALRKRVHLQKVTYPRRGVYLDMEGYVRPADKLRTLKRQDKCNNRYELLATDNPQQDSHRNTTLSYDTQWEELQDNVLWGCITFHHEA